MTTRLLPALLAVLLASTAACVEAPAEGVAEPAALSWSDTSSRASFSLWKSSDSQFRFRLVDADGVILLTSEGYTARTGALTGLVSVLANGGELARYQLRTSATGGHFVLRAGNGEVIGTSGTRRPPLARAGDVDRVGRRASASYRYRVGHRDRAPLRRAPRRRRQVLLEPARRQRRDRAALGALRQRGRGAQRRVRGARQRRRPRPLPGAAVEQRRRYYLNLTATNGQVIGTSEVYASKANAERARDALIALVPTVVLL
jgi:uncharacterized protein YegP (UPF0339 family)